MGRNVGGGFPSQTAETRQFLDGSNEKILRGHQAYFIDVHVFDFPCGVTDQPHIHTEREGVNIPGQQWVAILEVAQYTSEKHDRGLLRNSAWTLPGNQDEGVGETLAAEGVRQKTSPYFCEAVHCVIQDVELGLSNNATGLGDEEVMLLRGKLLHEGFHPNRAVH